MYYYYITQHKVDSVVKDTGRFYHFPIEYVIRHPSIPFILVHNNIKLIK